MLARKNIIAVIGDRIKFGTWAATKMGDFTKEGIWYSFNMSQSKLTTTENIYQFVDNIEKVKGLELVGMIQLGSNDPELIEETRKRIRYWE